MTVEIAVEAGRDGDAAARGARHDGEGLRHADELRHEMEHLDRSAAALSWLRKNGARVSVYLDTFVPTETSDSAMRATPFWTEQHGH